MSKLDGRCTCGEEALELNGELATHTTIGEDSGQETQRRFCPACGSPILSTSGARARDARQLGLALPG